MTSILQQWHQSSWGWFKRHAQSRHALAWLALVAFADAIFFPIAAEVFLVALVLAHPKRAWAYLLVSITSSVAGAAVGYLIAMFLFHQFGMPLLTFYHLDSAFRYARRFIGTHVFWAMSLASFTPFPDKVFIYAGGFLGVRFLPFITGYFVGRGIRMSLVTYFTGRYGAKVLDMAREYILITGGIVVVVVTIYSVLHWHFLGL